MRFLPSILALGLGVFISHGEGLQPTTAKGNFTAEQIEFFQQSVQPILAEHCFKCHGGGTPEADGTVKIKSGLQLISRLGVLKGGEHGPAYDATKPENSLLLKVISYDDEHLKMPPRSKLSADELSALEQWVKMGLPWTAGEEDKLITAADDSHKSEGPDNSWTYKPVVAPTPPQVAGLKNPIDAFLAKSLAEKGLKFSPPASPETLVRRAYYDLTGLPPTPAEVGQFKRDAAKDPQAFQKLVDQLLDSPHYGEKYARHWLDLMRYAETNGFERDGPKDYIWRYRQYVIDSFNDDTPYDRFIMEQIAGDELPDATSESWVATGYWRLMQWDDEPADRLQHQYDVLDDNVKTTSEVFLGATLGCARCHNHKADPLSQKDYYSFMAFLHGIKPYSKEGSFMDLNSGAFLGKHKRAPKKNALAAVETQIKTMEADARNKFAQKGIDAGQLALTQLVSDSRKDSQNWWFTTTEPPQDWAMPGFDPATGGWKESKGGFGTQGTPGGKIGTTWSNRGIWILKNFQLINIPQALRLIIHYDENARVYLNGQLVKSLEGFTTNYTNIDLGDDAIRALQTGKNVLAIHCEQTTGGQYLDAGLETGVLSIQDLIQKRGGDIFSEKEQARYKQLLADRAAAKLADSQPENGQRLAMVVTENGPKVEDLFVHVRGNAHAPGEKVEPLLPAIFNPPTPEILPTQKTSGRRLALAKWLASKDNPRTARVIANRLWQWHFGRGLAASSSDFGKLGTPCTNPQLLDWLSAELVKQNWSLKAMHRIVMNSAAYQQASESGAPADLAKKAKAADPANTLWWKFDMRRLAAEEVRDSILTVSGNLSPRFGGDSFFAELPDEVVSTASQGRGAWGNSPPEERTRRSIYMKIKRSMSDPLMKDFDQADTDSSCPSRFSTTVPTQALNFLNSKFLNDQAKVFAERLAKEAGPDLAAQIRLGIALCTQRPATEAEIQRLQKLHAEMQSQYKLAGQPALERVCLVMLNLNEFLFLD